MATLANSRVAGPKSGSSDIGKFVADVAYGMFVAAAALQALALAWWLVPVFVIAAVKPKVIPKLLVVGLGLWMMLWGLLETCEGILGTGLVPVDGPTPFMRACGKLLGG